MGTSSIYDGPKDQNPLLPDDFDSSDNIQENDKEKKPQVELNQKPWQAAKKSMSQYVTGSSKDYKGVIKNHIRASGGSSKMAEASSAGRSSTIRLGNLLSSITRQGIHKTLQDLHIELTGKSAEELLSELVNVISFESDTKEEIVAKNATIEALMTLYEYIEKNNMDISSLDHMDDTLFNAVMCNYISAYIWGRVLKDLQKSFEKYSVNPVMSVEKETDFKEYIKNTVEIQLSKIRLSTIDFKDKNIRSIILDLYKDCYEVLEGLV